MTGRSRPDVLDDAEVLRALEDRAPGFALEDGALVSVTRHGTFRGSLEYVNEVAVLAEAMDHHPDVAISWDQVTLRLVTHSAGGITERDLVLAEAISRLPPT